MGDAQHRRGARWITGRTVLGAIAALLVMSGIALAALGKTSPATHARRAAVRRSSPSRALAAAVSPPVVARVLVQAAATNRTAVYVPRPANSSPPAISGAALEGEILTEDHGTWSSSPTNYEYQWERCSSAGSGCQGVAQATAQTYLVAPADIGSTIRVQETAINGTGTGSPAVSALTATVRPAPEATPTAPPIPRPILGQRGVATVLSGTVRIRLKGTSRFVTLTGSTSIPTGSEVDATHGRVLIVVATAKPGETATAEVYDGMFEFEQNRGNSALARLVLSLPLTGCPQVRGGIAPRTARSSGAKHRPGPKSRRLWVAEGGGHWSTTGRYVSTTVEGTRWITSDDCGRSEVRVAAGRVRVRDLIRDTSRVISSGTRFVVTARRQG
jgi:hypothetical protein